MQFWNPDLWAFLALVGATYLAIHYGLQARTYRARLKRSQRVVKGLAEEYDLSLSELKDAHDGALKSDREDDNE